MKDLGLTCAVCGVDITLHEYQSYSGECPDCYFRDEMEREDEDDEDSWEENWEDYA